MKGLNKHPKYISLSRNGLILANMTVLTGNTPKVAKWKELITLIKPFNARWGLMGTYLLGTIYDVIDPFLLEMEKMSRIENDQHEICFVSVFFASP